MKICRFIADDKVYFGSIEGEMVKVIGSPFCKSDAAGDGHYKLSDVRLLAPVKPGKILCIGLNYRDHAQECGYDIPKTPVVFMKPSTTLRSNHATGVEMQRKITRWVMN